MRRKDREIMDKQRIKDIVEACDCCRLGLADERAPYIVPLNFGYFWEGERLFLFFHSAREGRKLELIERNGYAGFEMDTSHNLKRHELACGHSFGFQSIVGTGKISELCGEEERRAGLSMIMEHMTGKNDWEFQPEALAAVAVLRLEVEALSCKEH